MNRRVPLLAAAAGGSILTAAFLSAAVAAADDNSGDAASDASGITLADGTTVTPADDAFQDSPDVLFGDAPLLQAEQYTDQTLDVTTADGDDAGTVGTDVDVSNILGIESAQFTVTGTDPADIDAGDLESALDDAGISDSDFNSASQDGTVENAAQAFDESGTDFAGGDVTGDQVETALNFGGLSADDPGAIADALNDSSLGDAPEGLPEEGTVINVTDLTGGLDDNLTNLLGGGIYNVYEAVPAEDGGSSDVTDTLVTPFGNIDLSTPFDAAAHLVPGDLIDGVDASGGLFGGDEGADTADGVDVTGGDVDADNVADALSGNGIDISDAGFGADDIASALNDYDFGDVSGGTEEGGGLFDGGLFDGLGDIFGGGDGAEEAGGLIGDLIGGLF